MRKSLNFSSTILVLLVIFASCSDETLENAAPEIQLKAFQSGTDDGYYWQLWQSDGASGSLDYSNGSDGNYDIEWNNYNGNFTCGKGWSTGSTNRVIGYNAGVYWQNGGGGSFAVYGWTRNPLIEYYVQEMWPGSRPTSGTSMGTINSDGATYDLRREQRENAPSIDGTQTFWQLKSTRRSQAPTGETHTVTFANHAQGWANGGMSLGSNHDYQILLTEAWGTSSGHANATVWEQGSSGGDNGGNNGGGSGTPLRLRARSTDGQGQVSLIVNGNTVQSWTLGSSMGDYEATAGSGDIRVEFTNDASGRDVQIDYLSVDGDWRQAEDQSYNTGVYQDGSCGGSNSEWLHCNGSIGFGDMP